MNKSFLEKAIEKRAEKRFEEDFESACKSIAVSPILNRLKIGKHSLGNNMGYSNTDLFVKANPQSDSLKNETNFLEVKETLINKYIQEETYNVLNQVDILQNFLENNG